MLYISRDGFYNYGTVFYSSIVLEFYSSIVLEHCDTLGFFWHQEFLRVKDHGNTVVADLQNEASVHHTVTRLQTAVTQPSHVQELHPLQG